MITDIRNRSRSKKCSNYGGTKSWRVWPRRSFQCRLLSQATFLDRRRNSRSSMIDDYQWLVNLKVDTSMIERQPSSKSSVHVVQKKKGNFSQQSSQTEGKLPRSPCWQCGQMHFVRDCPFSNHQCIRIGHKEGYCGCFSKPKSVPPGEEKCQRGLHRVPHR